MVKIVFGILVVLTEVYTLESGCPNPQLIAPCVCKDNGINCGGNSGIDLVHIFETLETNLTKSEKHFNGFYLNNTAITELKENTFKDITFDNIDIDSCKNLKMIHRNAFINTDLVTKQLYIQSNPHLTSPDNSIYEIVTKFVNVQEVQLVNNNISEIPSNAFHSTISSQVDFTKLVISGNSITKLGNNAFSTLNSLQWLYIEDLSIDYVPEFALASDKNSNSLHVWIFSNQGLNNSNFHPDSLTHFKRPVNLDIGYSHNNFTFIEEKLFRKFLDINIDNKIDMAGLIFDCNDCKNKWLIKNPDYLNRIANLKCSNGKNITDPNNFANCGPDQKLKPCTFVENESAIYCGGNTEINLKSILTNFSNELKDKEKHFKTFYLNNISIKVLEENTFNDLTFDKIVIANCTNLVQINENAFTATNMVTKNLEIYGNPELITETNPQLFNTLSRFLFVEKIVLAQNGLTEIPSNAFQPLMGYQEKLESLEFKGPFIKLGSNAFSHLRNLSWIKLDQVKFDSIPENAFEFDHATEKVLTIHLNSSQITSKVFRKNSLANMKRKAHLVFGDSSRQIINEQDNYLDDEVFLPFLLENDENKIEFISKFNCNDCRNYWLKKQPNLLTRINNLGCSNNKTITDPDNFKNCSY